MSTQNKESLSFHPIDSGRWDDLVALFGERGACGECWCMWWKLAPKEFAANKGAGNKARLQ